MSDNNPAKNREGMENTESQESVFNIEQASQTPEEGQLSVDKPVNVQEVVGDNPEGTEVIKEVTAKTANTAEAVERTAEADEAKNLAADIKENEFKPEDPNSLAREISKAADAKVTAYRDYIKAQGGDPDTPFYMTRLVALRREAFQAAADAVSAVEEGEDNIAESLLNRLRDLKREAANPTMIEEQFIQNEELAAAA